MYLGSLVVGFQLCISTDRKGPTVKAMLDGSSRLRLQGFILLCFLPSLLRASPKKPPPRLVFAPVSHAKSGTNVTVLKHVVDCRHNGYLAVTDEKWVVVMAPTVDPTSAQAKKHSCKGATNGGPFKSFVRGGCIGGVVINGHVASSDFSSHSVGYGIGRSNNQEVKQQWVIGGVANETEAMQDLGLEQFVTGFGWLVYNGESVVDDGNDNPTGIKEAPRTTIGVDNQGRLMLLVVDGCEKW